MDNIYILQRIKEIEEEIHRTQKNKATEYHLGVLKAKMAQLRRQLYAPSGKGKASGFGIRKEGDATSVFIGFPSVGKSTILNELTNAKSEIGTYEFTTLKTIPGMLKYKDASIQMLDIPGIISGASLGKGRGREVLSIVRASDLLIIVLDAKHMDKYKIIINELHIAGIRINMERPRIYIKKTNSGGLLVHASKRFLKHISKEEVKAVLRTYGYTNSMVTLNGNMSIDDIIDALEKNRVYTKGLVVVNKIDTVKSSEIKQLKERLEKLGVRDYVFVSGEKSTGIQELKQKIYSVLHFIRVYTKNKRGETTDKPLILTLGDTIRVMCEQIHRDFVKNFRYSLIWGASVKYPGQRVGLEHKLKDGDIVKIVVK